MPRVKTIEQLRKELAVREKAVKSLSARRVKAVARLAAIDHAIALATGGKAPSVAGIKVSSKVRVKRRKRGAGKRGTAKGGLKLVDVLKGVLGKSDQPMRVMDIEKAAVEAGYKSSSTDFYGIVATALRAGDVFKKVDRGLYKLA